VFAPTDGVKVDAPVDPTDDQSLGLPYEVLPHTYCEGVGLPPGSRAYGDVTKEQLLTFARAVRLWGEGGGSWLN